MISVYVVCLSGMFNCTSGGRFTIFHAPAIFTFGTTTLGGVQIRPGNVTGHAANLIGSYAGALVAGAFAALAPGRVLPTLAVDDPILLWSVVALIVVIVTAWAAWVMVRFGHR